MDGDAIFRKTSRGAEEIERRDRRLPTKERLLLILVDGTRSLREITGAERDWSEVAQKLLSAGFVEVVAPESVLPQASSRWNRAVQASPMTSLAQQAETDPKPAPVAAGDGSTADENFGETQNWLTATITRLSSLFVGVSDGEQAPRRTAGAVVADEEIPFFDVTAPAARVRQDVRPARPPAPTGFPDTFEDVPVLGADARREPVLHPLAALSAAALLNTEASAPPPLRKAPAPQASSLAAKEASAAGGESQDCPGRSACAGCAHCPVRKSTHEARNFMKEHLWRLSGQHAKPLLQQIDGCSSRRDLQRQFEPWLQLLLLTRQGSQEAPTLTAQLVNILHQ